MESRSWGGGTKKQSVLFPAYLFLAFVFISVRSLNLGGVRWHNELKTRPSLLTFAAEHQPIRWLLNIFMLYLCGFDPRWLLQRFQRALCGRRRIQPRKSPERDLSICVWLNQTNLTFSHFLRAEPSELPSPKSRAFAEITASDCFPPIRYPPRVEKWCHKRSSLFYNALVFAQPFFFFLKFKSQRRKVDLQ